MNTALESDLQQRLCRSEIFKDYARAFGEATDLPLTFSSADDWHLAHHGVRHENPFCALLARNNKGCAACLRAQHELTAEPDGTTRTVSCFAGLSETAVPLRIGERLIGYLRTGEVLLHKPQRRDFSRITMRLAALGATEKIEGLEAAYFETRVLSPKRYESIVRLLEIFAQHLAMIASQLTFQREHSEAPQTTLARQYIQEHMAEDISLKQVAAAAHMSTFYFCKKFHQAVGCTFTEYLSRMRIESAKSMLMNPHARVTEVAFDSGFQSITHFNRVFKNLVGQSPTEYRSTLAKVA